MRIYRLDLNRFTLLHEVHQLGKLVSHEAQTVHSRVKLDMDREIRHATLFKHVAEHLERIHVRDARLKTIVHNLIEGVCSGRKHHNRRLDSCLAELKTLNRICHCKIVCTSLFHKGSELHCAMAISIGLDQHQKLRLVLKLRTEISIILKTAVQVYLQP